MTWVLIVGMATITYLNRYAFLTRAIEYVPGDKVKRFLSYSSYSVLTAIWTPIVLQMEHDFNVSLSGLDYLIGASLAMVMSVARFPSLLTVILSTSVFFGIRFWA